MKIRDIEKFQDDYNPTREKIKRNSKMKIGIRMLGNEDNLYTLSKLADLIKTINGSNN